jgi:hypothetical protein
MANGAADPGPDLLETWLILEYCDQGSFDHAIRTGKFTNDLVGEAGRGCLLCLNPCWPEGLHAELCAIHKQTGALCM